MFVTGAKQINIRFCFFFRGRLLAVQGFGELCKPEFSQVISQEINPESGAVRAFPISVSHGYQETSLALPFGEWGSVGLEFCEHSH